MSEGWLNLTEAARFIGVSARTLRLAVERGEFKAEHPLPEGPWIFNRNAMDANAVAGLAARARAAARYATLNEAASRTTGAPVSLFEIDGPRLDFGGVATLYGWRHVRASVEEDLSTFLALSGGRVESNTLLELVVDPAMKPVGASRHF